MSASKDQRLVGTFLPQDLAAQFANTARMQSKSMAAMLRELITIAVGDRVVPAPRGVGRGFREPIARSGLQRH